MDQEKLKMSAFFIQSLGTMCICFLAGQTGFVIAWPSYTVANFTSNFTVLGRPMSSMEVSLLGGLPNLGGFLVSPFCGYIFNKLGRKYATVVFGIPYTIAWLMISLTKDVTLILTAMTIAGVGIAGQNVSLIFISEICHDSIRGSMTACSACGYCLGILISYILGGYLSYDQVIYTHLGLSVLCILALMVMKESPVYLVMVGKEEEAAKSIAFYNQVEISSKVIEKEIKKIKIQLDPRLEKILEGETDEEVMNKLLATSLGETVETRKTSSWKLFRKSKSSKRALVTVFVMIATTIMMGAVVLQVYAEPLFLEAVPSMSPNLCAIFLALDFLVASLGCVLAIDRFGRKLLMLVTSVLSGICTLLLGAQLQLHFAPPWFTALMIYLFSFVYTVGCGVIPFVLAAEVFLPEVRGLCNSACMGFVWVVNFIALVVFMPLVEAWGLGPVFCCFSISCFVGAIYTGLQLPETKGLSVEAIQAKFLNR